MGYFSFDNLPTLSGEKNNIEQLEMCFKANETENWKVTFD